MDDLLQRLRAASSGHPSFPRTLCIEAADKIEMLEQALQRIGSGKLESYNDAIRLARQTLQNPAIARRRTSSTTILAFSYLGVALLVTMVEYVKYH